MAMQETAVASWNGLDWLLLVVMAAAMVRGYMKGAVRAILAVAGVMVGFLVASGGYKWFGERVALWVSPPQTARVVAYLVIAVVVAAAFSFGGRALEKTSKPAGLEFFDQVMGAAFGFVRGCLFCVVVLLGMAVAQPQSELVFTSQLSPYFLAVAHEVSFVVPKDLQDQITDRGYQMQQNLPDWMKRR